MSLTVHTRMTVREQGRTLFADFPETPNRAYSFSHFQMVDGSTVWCRANRTAPGGPIYHFVKILNPQHPENREFHVFDTSRLQPLERRQYLPFEDLIFDREREIQLQEMQTQREELNRSFAVVRQQQADIRQQQADIRQQHAQMRALNSRQDALIEQLTSEAQVSRSELTRAQQNLLSMLGLAPTADVSATLQRIATGTANIPDPNPILGSLLSRTSPSANLAVPSSTVRSLSAPNLVSHPVINQVGRDSISENPPIASSATHSFPSAIDSFSDGSTPTSQGNDEPSFWQKMQEGISCFFAQIISSIQCGWEYFVSLF